MKRASAYVCRAAEPKREARRRTREPKRSALGGRAPLKLGTQISQAAFEWCNTLPQLAEEVPR